jgi:hypothetical protein
MKDRNLVHSDNWATPIEFYDNLDLEFAFNFDPCPLNLNEITDETDGLLIDWGTSNFINPPYSRQLKEKFEVPQSINSPSVSSVISLRFNGQGSKLNANSKSRLS